MPGIRLRAFQVADQLRANAKRALIRRLPGIFRQCHDKQTGDRCVINPMAGLVEVKVILAGAVAFVGGAILVLPSGSSAAEKFKRASTSKQFKAAVAGRKLVAGSAYYIVHANGTFSGKSLEGAKVSGKWNWRGQYFCRSGTIGNETLAYDCQEAYVSRNKLRLVRNRGRGSTVELRIR